MDDHEIVLKVEPVGDPEVGGSFAEEAPAILTLRGPWHMVEYLETHLEICIKGMLAIMAKRDREAALAAVEKILGTTDAVIQ